MWQTQKAGDGAALVQAQNINIGVGVQDVEYISKKMAMEVFSAYSRDAFKLMSERVEVFAQTYVDQLLRESPEAIKNIKDPGIQAAILEAESAYAKTGDDNLGSLLIDILTQRTRTLERDVVQLALSESIEVAQKLTHRQYSSLSLIFLLRHVKFGASHLEELKDKFQANLAPVAAEAVVSSTHAQHLVATGCAILQPIKAELSQFILSTYPGFFTLGLTRDDPTVKQLPDIYFTTCLRDTRKIQVNAADTDALEKMMTENQATDDERQMLTNLLQANLMQPDDVLNELTGLAPAFTSIHEKWQNSMFGQLSLTSVGMVLAHSNVLRVTEGRFDAPLKTFLPEG